MKITIRRIDAADLEETTVSSEPARALPRRTLLAVSGTAVLATAAACSSGSGSPTTTAGPTTSAAGASPTSAGSSAASSAASSASSAASSAPAAGSSAASSEAAPTGTPVASVADVQAAGAVVVEASSGPLLLAYADGTVVAHTAVCTHQQCTIAASGLCPCHQSQFNVTTGAVEKGPALRPLAQENVTVSGGQVYLA
ncbi:Rieske (2Fe-2S) protein [Nakamurella sp.]|uniref:Rieske (2Fe-2S) protein n=1 Tax=Nakamurella sp. TaxID=1869182 RepID=UPI003B3A04D3